MIARLAVLCVVELLVVVLLALQLFAAPAAPTTPPPRDDATPASAPSPTPLVPATGDAPAPLVSGASAPDPAPQHRQEVAAKWIADDPVGVLLTGAIRFADGTRVTQASIWAERDKQRVSGSGAEGTYALAGLAPGEWTVHVGGTDSADRQEALVLTDDAVQQRDFVLERSFAIRVMIVTASGEDASAALRKAQLYQFDSFAVAGQRDRFPDRLAPTDYGVAFVGDAKWDGEMNPKDGFAGTLRLVHAPPAHVALLQRHLVLEQQVVQPGQGEVRFVIDVDALKALAGSATARVVDADTGQPITGARLSLDNRHGPGVVTDADGRATAKDLSPGLLRCEISAKDHEQMYTTVRVEPGMQLDLGEIRLGPALPLTGRVVDVAGKPVGGAQLRWAELKWLGDVLPFATNRAAQSDAEGAFTLYGTGRGAIAVTASTRDGLQARAVFDNPPAEPVVLQVGATGECVVTRPDDPTRSFTIVWFDALRRPVGASALGGRMQQHTLKLPTGEHAFEVRENGRVVQTGTVQVGETTARLEIR